MRIVLLSGGSGKRLWPLSSGSRTKQFLKVLGSGKGERKSMVQRVWGQLREAGLADSVYIATNASQIDLIRSQLGDEVPLIIEPERRDTFPAIALTTVYLLSETNASEEETVCILPVDSYVESSFFHRIKQLEEVLQAPDTEVALMGSQPTYPSEKYGYMLPADRSETGHLDIQAFVEKPDRKEAEKLIEAGALWNCGVCAFKLRFLLDWLKERGLPCTYEEMIREYRTLPAKSFDYEVLGQMKRLKAVVYHGPWKDLGTWNTLTEVMDGAVVGKGMISPDSVNSHVVNELEVPVMLLGLSNVVVAVSSDGILVSDKTASQRIKDMAELFDQRPMYEELRWGWYRILDYSSLEEGQETMLKKVVIRAGMSTGILRQPKRRKIWTIRSGTGQVMVQDQIYPAGPGDCFQIEEGMKHSMLALEELTVVEIQTGSSLFEDEEEQELREDNSDGS
ncbi:sugar phosphate nucleotidyltransferase [Paenibacillus cremeus]|uniref:Mannose-1-phosphate guanylyltransferase n=1 Tax=Paenibacillus cremeus TaxID=2163881 RepID=A0A559KIA4_9BACL|nr:sugar phosphate nucleotidyltransferase [Paenibacillus cremeus]TVY11839.1 mannose-1-phosphate guanylyltransferase [Paenibacillus cremeus]